MTSPANYPNILLLAADGGTEKLDSYALMVASRDILSVLHEHAQEGFFEGTLERMDPGPISGLAAVLLEGSLGDRKCSAPQFDTVPLLASMDRAARQFGETLRGTREMPGSDKIVWAGLSMRF